jgi:hypothetical protein
VERRWKERYTAFKSQYTSNKMMKMETKTGVLQERTNIKISVSHASEPGNISKKRRAI